MSVLAKKVARYAAFCLIAAALFAAGVEYLPSDFHWQDALWGPPSAMGNGWWVMVGLIAAVSAAIHFLFLVMNQKFSALLVARMAIFVGIVMLALSPLNSGWLPWAALTFAVSTLLTGFLIATDWCNRQTPWRDGARMVGGWLQTLSAFLTGGGRHHADSVALTRDGHD